MDLVKGEWFDLYVIQTGIIMYWIHQRYLMITGLPAMESTTEVQIGGQMYPE